MYHGSRDIFHEIWQVQVEALFGTIGTLFGNYFVALPTLILSWRFPFIFLPKYSLTFQKFPKKQKLPGGAARIFSARQRAPNWFGSNLIKTLNGLLKCFWCFWYFVICKLKQNYNFNLVCIATAVDTYSYWGEFLAWPSFSLWSKDRGLSFTIMSTIF